MKNLKTKIGTLLIGSIILSLGLNFSSNLTYAKAQEGVEAAKDAKIDEAAADAKAKAEKEVAAKKAQAGKDAKAQAEAEADANNLTYGTFSVSKNLTLDNGDQPKKYFNDSQNSPIVSFILSVINFATTIMGSLAVLLFIVAGFMFMFYGGSSQKLDEAKDVVKYATIGLVIAFLSYIIAIFVQSIFQNG